MRTVLVQSLRRPSELCSSRVPALRRRVPAARHPVCRRVGRNGSNVHGSC
jgi:hypothetical protein